MRRVLLRGREFEVVLLRLCLLHHLSWSHFLLLLELLEGLVKLSLEQIFGLGKGVVGGLFSQFLYSVRIVRVRAVVIVVDILHLVELLVNNLVLKGLVLEVLAFDNVAGLRVVLNRRIGHLRR